MANEYYVYILRCADNSMYIGITTDLERRLIEHNSSKLGAKYTKARRPVELAYKEKCLNRSGALKREYEIKQYTRQQKLDLLEGKKVIKKSAGKIKTITVNDSFQKKYKYELVQPEGKNFDPEFKPYLTPKEMLELGIFGGTYLNGSEKEFPLSWFKKAKVSPTHNKKLNYFGVDASQPLAVWNAKGWIYKDDPRGWFQWYCRYYMGRRLPGEDDRQIKRWKAMRRHAAQIANKCRPGDMNCNIKQRQALLHWAYDSRRL